MIIRLQASIKIAMNCWYYLFSGPYVSSKGNLGAVAWIGFNSKGSPS